MQKKLFLIYILGFAISIGFYNFYHQSNNSENKNIKNFDTVEINRLKNEFIKKKHTKDANTSKKGIKKEVSENESPTNTSSQQKKERIPVKYVPEYEFQVHAYCDQCNADISGNIQAHFYDSHTKGGKCKTYHYEQLEIYVGEKPIYND